MKEDTLVGTVRDMDTIVKKELLQLAAIYGIPVAAIQPFMEVVDFYKYAEYAFGERGLEVITGGVGMGTQIAEWAKKLDVAAAVVEAFERCIEAFPNKMVYFKECFGEGANAPTLYVNLMESLENAWPFLNSLTGFETSLSELKARGRAGRLCVLIGFSMEADGLVLKTYFPSNRQEKAVHDPLLISHRFSATQFNDNPKYYKYQAWNQLETTHEALREITIQIKKILPASYRTIYGYYHDKALPTQPKFYVFRNDLRSNNLSNQNSLYHTEGNILLLQGKYAEAIISFSNAIDYTSSDFTAHAQRSLCHAILRQRTAALQDAETALSLEPEMNFRQAKLFVDQIKTFNHLTSELEAAPTAVAHNQLGTLFFNYQLLQEAKRHFQQAIQLAPDFAEAHNNLGGTCINLGEYAEAFAASSKAIALDEQTDTTNYLLALKGMQEEA